MSQLSNNTTALRALLEAVEALPEAGGGGGLTQKAEGTVAAASSAKSTLTVTGLAFKPLVVFWFNTSFMSGYNAVGICTELYTYYRNSTSATTPTFTATDSGFTISGSAIRPASREMKWIALG